MSHDAPRPPSLDAARRQIAEHQRAFDDTTRAALGIFYTTPVIARAVARAALRSACACATSPRDIEALRVLDPAAGAGALLLEALLVLEEAHRTLAPEMDESDRRSRLSHCLHAIEIDPSSAERLRAIFRDIGSDDIAIATQDALLDPLPDGWPERFDAIVSNPPFGTINRLGRGSPRAAALSERFQVIWQDKMDRAAFFVARSLEFTARAAFVLPATLLAADKSQRWRAWLSTHDVRVFDIGDAVCFEDTRIRTALLDIRVGNSTSPSWRGWRLTGEERLEAALEAFGGNDTAPEGVISAREAMGTRWHIIDAERRERWARMDEGGELLGERYPVGKGMETGCNRAFELPTSVISRLDEETCGRWVRRRIRGVEIGRLHLEPPSRWLLYAPAADAMDDLPEVLREHLEGWRERLEKRAAYRRGNCAWWTWTWPLHASRYANMYRVITGYRGREHRFAVVPPGGGIGLTDTTAVFAASEVEAWALAGWLCSAAATERYVGIGKETGGGMREFFENQLRELPLPRDWERCQEDIARAAKTLASAPTGEHAKTLDAAVWRAYGSGSMVE